MIRWIGTRVLRESLFQFRSPLFANRNQRLYGQLQLIKGIATELCQGLPYMLDVP